MRAVVDLDIQGLGVILYSPFAVRHIAQGQDYLMERFWNPSDVAEHVMACQLSAFGTGSPGQYRLTIYDGPVDVGALERAECKIRLGIEVRDRTLCFRDLYDLMSWSPECPASQSVTLADGFYRITAYTSPPESGIIGDGQDIGLHLELVPERPRLKWAGVPDLSEPYRPDAGR